jgi:hypothetical protein
MRDIRGDLQDRAKLIEEQISSTQSQFDKFIEKVKVEHRDKLQGLKCDLDNIHVVMKTEDKLQSEATASEQLRQQAQSQQRTSNVLQRKMSGLSVR